MTPKPKNFPGLGAAKNLWALRLDITAGIDLSLVNLEVIDPDILECSNLDKLTLDL